MPTVRGDPDEWLRRLGIDEHGNPLPKGGDAPAPAKPGKVELVDAAFTPPACWVVPLVTASTANGRDWRVRSKLTVAARLAVSRALGPKLGAVVPFAWRFHSGQVVRPRFVRLGGQRLDRGNVAVALKAVEDAVCLVIGADDGAPNWQAEYLQEPGGPLGVRVELAVEVSEEPNGVRP